LGVDIVAVLTMAFTAAGLLSIVPSALLYRHNKKQLQAAAEKAGVEQAAALQGMALDIAKRLEHDVESLQAQLLRALEVAESHERRANELTAQLEEAHLAMAQMRDQIAQMGKELATYRGGDQGTGGL
jgi:septation ring formation regulator EzrA